VQHSQALLQTFVNPACMTAAVRVACKFLLEPTPQVAAALHASAVMLF
jgi:hypothetical protein